jgi:hypothetical protein
MSRDTTKPSRGAWNPGFRSTATVSGSPQFETVRRAWAFRGPDGTPASLLTLGTRCAPGAVEADEGWEGEFDQLVTLAQEGIEGVGVD